MHWHMPQANWDSMQYLVLSVGHTMPRRPRTCVRPSFQSAIFGLSSDIPRPQPGSGAAPLQSHSAHASLYVPIKRALELRGALLRFGAAW